LWNFLLLEPIQLKNDSLRIDKSSFYEDNLEIRERTSRSQNKYSNLNLNESESVIINNNPNLKTEINYEELITKLEEPYYEKLLRMKKLVKTKLFDSYKLFNDQNVNKINQIIMNKNTNINSIYKDYLILNSSNEFLRR